MPRGRAVTRFAIPAAGIFVFVLVAIFAGAQKNTAKKIPHAPADPPQPPVELRLPLASLGYPGERTSSLIHGESLRSIDYVDNTHLLLTFSMHILMQRQQECSVDDRQQLIQAVLIELPTGHITAQSQWPVCDRAKYLWPMGDGRFLLRQNNRIGMITPLEGNAGTALTPREVARYDGRVLAVTISPDSQLFIVQYRMPSPVEPEKLPGITTNGLGLHDPDTLGKVSVNLYAHAPDPEHAGAFKVESRGNIQAPNIIWLPFSANGFLDALNIEPEKLWEMRLLSFDDQRIGLTEVSSSCAPGSVFVSEDAFLTLFCPLGTNDKALSAYSLRRGLLWRQRFIGPVASISSSIAPDAGRFALSVVTTLYRTNTFEPLSLDNAAGQWVRVYDTHTGGIYATVEASPIQTDNRNYTLSPDGTHLATLSADVVNIYAMPPNAQPQ